MKLTDRLIVFLVTDDKDKNVRALAKLALNKEQLEELAAINGSYTHGMVVHPTRKKYVYGKAALVTTVELPYVFNEEAMDVYHVISDLVRGDCSVCVVSCASSIDSPENTVLYDAYDPWFEGGGPYALFEYHSYIEVK